MSIALRQAAQPLLDNIGLSQFHIEIAPSTKFLSIVGECGKPLVTLSGIRFSKSDPTKKEIDYSCSLLDTYLSKNSELLLSVYKAKLAQSILVQPLARNYANVAGISQVYNGNFQVVVDLAVAPRARSVTISFTEEVDLATARYGFTMGATTKDLVDILNNTNGILDGAMAYARDSFAYAKASTELQAEIAKLNNCGI
jgi:hypothetical protein